MPDTLVIGRGPTGLLAASALRSRGLAVTVVGPSGPWTNVYGAWQDELDDVGLGGCVAHAWDGVDVFLGNEPTRWDRRYVQVDNAALQARLAIDAVDDVVCSVTPHPGYSEVETRLGRLFRAHVVIDASGHDSAFVERPAGPPSLVQSAVGWRVRGTHPYPVGRARWMDFRDAHRASDDPEPATATFAYVLPYGPDDVFVEETALARHPAVSPERLEARLRRRLAHDGVTVREVTAVERCFIPMTPMLPVSGQRTLAFGAAAGFVHPATGYQLVAAARRAPLLADAVAAGLPDGPLAAAARGWDALWPGTAVRTRALYAFGARFTATLDPAATRRFFQAFFALPEDTRAAWLSDRLTPAALARAMATVFVAADPGTRWGLVRAAAAEPQVLLRSLTGL